MLTGKANHCCVLPSKPCSPPTPTRLPNLEHHVSAKRLGGSAHSRASSREILVLRQG